MFKIIFTFVPFIFALSLVPLFAKPAKLRKRNETAALAAFLACASKFLGFRLLGGDAFAPELPQPLIWFWNWVYSGMCILFALSLALVPARLAARRFFEKASTRRCWLVALPAVALAASAVGVWNGLRPPGVTRFDLEFENLPEELDGYRIVHITDIHASAASRRWRTEAIVRAANSLDADLICLTGDYVDGLSEDESRNLEPIAKLAAKDGVYAVAGNHEYYFDTLGWSKVYALWGIPFLHNSCVFPRPGLALSGVPDPACTCANLPPPNPDKALSAATNGEFRILLQHRPYANYRELCGIDMSEKCDLQLSGHTHGGIAPAMNLLVGQFNGGMVKGLYLGSDGRTIYVSQGAGQWAGFPIRFFNDPEIAEITLKKKKQRQVSVKW